MFYGNSWWDYSCKSIFAFICQSTSPVVVKENSSLTFEFSQEQLTFGSFTVEYRYTLNHNLLGSSEDKRMTGFRLSWFVQNRNQSRLTGRKPDMPANWKPVAEVPKYLEQNLVNMVNIAAGNELTRDALLEKMAKEKSSHKFVYSNLICSGNQVTDKNFPTLFEDISEENNTFETEKNISEQDIVTGFMIFSSLIHCSESIAISQFLHNLLSTQSPRTIIQATVNTIQADYIREKENRMSLNKFFMALNSIFSFHLGRILLATSSSSQLKSMMSKDWPYFNQFYHEMDECLNDASCQGVKDIVQTLGNI